MLEFLQEQNSVKLSSKVIVPIYTLFLHNLTLCIIRFLNFYCLTGINSHVILMNNFLNINEVYLLMYVGNSFSFFYKICFSIPPFLYNWCNIFSKFSQNFLNLLELVLVWGFFHKLFWLHPGQIFFFLVYFMFCPLCYSLSSTI